MDAHYSKHPISKILRKNRGLWKVYGKCFVQFNWSCLKLIIIHYHITAVLPLFLEQMLLESFCEGKIMKETTYQGTLLAFSRWSSKQQHSSTTTWTLRLPWKANLWSVKLTKKHVNLIWANIVGNARFVFTKATSGYFSCSLISRLWNIIPVILVFIHSNRFPFLIGLNLPGFFSC